MLSSYSIQTFIWPQKSTVTHWSDYLAVVFFLITPKRVAEDYIRTETKLRRTGAIGGRGAPE